MGLSHLPQPASGAMLTGSDLIEFLRAARSLNLCWNLVCTTCGANDLRRGLHALVISDFAPGDVPNVDAWRRWCDSTLGPSNEGCPRSSYTAASAEALGGAAAAAPLTAIAAACGFPTWLGYLGFMLAEIQNHRAPTRAVTRSWVPQLIEMGGNPSLWKSYLEPERALSWKALGRAEAEGLGA